MVQNFQKVRGGCMISHESMLTISYHLVQSIFEVLNAHRSKTLDTSYGKKMDLLFSVHSASPFLKTATTLASFQFCGKEAVLNDLSVKQLAKRWYNYQVLWLS